MIDRIVRKARHLGSWGIQFPLLVLFIWAALAVEWLVKAPRSLGLRYRWQPAPKRQPDLDIRDSEYFGRSLVYAPADE